VTTITERAVGGFVDAGILAIETGVARQAATTLADRLIAEGHGDALAEITAAFWTANAARLALRDRWAAHARERSALDPGQMEPPPPPPPPTEDPPPQPQPDPGGDQ
jgi:hypothetical protein